MKRESNIRRCLSGVYDLLSWVTDASGCKYYKRAQNMGCRCHNESSPIWELDGECPWKDEVTENRFKPEENPQFHF